MEVYSITVIVPVYNVEKYIDKCLQSLLNQTYRNFEIILVNDGSTDSSDIKCDEYAKRFDYIRVIHKKNGGQSDARNTGLQYAKFPYITFVDSDDYVDSDYLEVLVSILECNHADIAICGHVVEDPMGKQYNDHSCNGSVVLFKNYEAIEEMCYEEKFGTTPCAKLIKKDIALNNMFPVGMIYEDLATMYKMLGEATTIAFIDKKMYHYVIHFGSTTKNIWSNKVMNVMEASNDLLSYIKDNYPLISSAGIYRYFFSANEVYVRAFNEENYIDIIAGIRVKMKEYWPQIISNRRIGYKQLFRYWLMKEWPVLYKYIWRLKSRVNYYEKDIFN